MIGHVRHLLLGALGVAALAATGCASTDDSNASTDDTTGRGLAQVSSFDPRDRALTCLGKAKVPARKAGDDAIAVRGVPRVRYTPNASGAESEALAGRAEGAEQIGRALLYVGGVDEAELTVLERCLRG